MNSDGAAPAAARQPGARKLGSRPSVVLAPRPVGAVLPDPPVEVNPSGATDDELDGLEALLDEPYEK